MSSERERQHSRIPLAVLLLIALIILMYGLLNRLDDSRWNLGRLSHEKVEIPHPDDMSAQVGRLKDLSESSKILRASPVPIAPLEPEEIDANGAFPKTSDFVTSRPLELAMLQDPGEVLGWVTDNKSAPIAGANVKLKFENEPEQDKEAKDAAKPLKFEAHSNEAGLFLISKVPPGTWSVIAEKEGFATGVVTGITVQPRERPSPVVLHLEPEIRVKGVVKAGDQPVANATVLAYRDHISVHEGGIVDSVRIVYTDVYTNEKGEFDLPQLPAGEMNLLAKAVGYVPATRKVNITAKMDPVEIKLDSESLIIGSVRTERGRPIENAELSLTNIDVKTPDKLLTTIKSEKGGGFIFRELPANFRFNLFAKAENYAAYGPEPVASGTTTNIVIMLAGGSIEGKVINFETGKPEPNITIVAAAQAAAQPVSLMTKTTTTGEYRMTRLPAGNYDLAVFNEGLTSEPRMGVAVAANAVTKGIDFSVYPGINIAGTVVDADTKERIVNAKVTLKSKVGPGFLMTKTTQALSDELGEFKYTNMPQGIYELTAEATGYVRALGDESTERVEALRGSTPEPAEIRLQRGGTIEGVVSDPNGSAVSEALVQLFHAPGSPSRIKAEEYKTVTSGDGTFVLDGIPLQGELHLYVSAWAKNYGKARSEKIILSRDQNFRTVQVVLGDGALLDVSVKDPLGSGITDVSLELGHANFPGDAAPPAWKQKTTNTGQATFEKVPVGKVTVSASRKGYLTTTGSANISPDSEIEKLTITMQPAFVLTGHVQDDMLQPIRAGRVNARPEAGAKGSGSSAIAADSTYKIESLGEGTFNVEAVAQINTDTGGRQIVWGYAGIVPNNGMSDTMLVVPMNGAMEGRVIIADVNGPPPNFTVGLSATYIDDANRKQGFNASFTFSGTDEFRFDSLPPGEYRIRVTAPNFLPATAGPFDVVSPGVFSAGTIKLNPGGLLRYKVVDASTGESIAGANGKLEPEGPAGKSDGEGKTTITPIKPGIYTLNVTHPDYLPKEFPLVQIIRGKEIDEGVLKIEPGALLYGTVTDGAGKPTPSILVEAHSITDDVLRRTSTDSSGNYTIRGLGPGSHDLTFSGTVNARRVTKNLQVTVSVFEDTRQDIELWANSELDGQLLAAPDVDLRRSVITLYPMRSDNFPLVNEAIKVTDIISNRFLAKNLIEGYYLVSVQAPGAGRTSYFSDVARVFSRTSSTTIREGTIQLNGRVLATKGGAPVVAQEVRLDLLSSTQSGIVPLRRWWLWTAKTDKLGNFSIGHLPQGTYSLVARNEALKADILQVITVTNDRQIVTDDFFFN